MNQGMVFDIMRFSTRDGPGIRTTVFLKGCPLHCAWCHNPESQKFSAELMLRPQFCIGCLACVDVCPQAGISVDEDGHLHTNFSRCTNCGACVEACYADARMLVGREMSTAAVMAEILKDRIFYEQSGGGVTFSGGEALAQRAFLLALLKECQERRIHTAVDTSGYVPWAVLESVRPFVDLFLYDIKALDDSVHRQYTGVSNRQILENLIHLSQLGERIIARVPLIPGVNDSPQALDALAEFVGRLPALEALELLPYHEAGVDKYRRLDHTAPLTGVRPPDAEMMQRIVDRLSAHGVPVQLGG